MTEQGIYFVAGNEQPFSSDQTDFIKFLRFSTGKIEDIVQLGGPPFFGLTVSPDGRWLVYSQVEQLGSDLMLVDNFR